LEGYKLKEYAAIMGGRGIGKSFITDSVLAWYYMIFDKQEIIVSATSPIVEEAWDKVVDTIKAIEKEYPGLKQHQMVKSNKKIVAGTEYYDTNNDLQVRGSENEIRRITYADNPNVTSRPHFQHIEEYIFPSHPGKGSLKTV
jgi:ERCC4-related helicase